MHIELYTLLIPQLQRSLNSLKAMLDKAELFAKDKNFDSTILLSCRLAPDQYPLVKQIQIACDTAKFLPVRLCGLSAPKHEDNESSLAECQSRIDSTLAFLSEVPKDAFKGYETKEASFPWYPGKKLSAEAYLVQFALPNFYFHLSTAYAILRHNGVALGKADYLGQMDWQDA